MNVSSFMSYWSIWSERNARTYDETDVSVLELRLPCFRTIRGFASLLVSWNC